MWEFITHMKEILLSIGFDEKEADIYIALIKTGKASVNDLLKKTSIERRTIYDVLERLIQKGRASYFEENNTRKYLPTKPELILQDLREKENGFKELLPQLRSLQEEPTQARVEVLKGVHGIKILFLEIIACRRTHYLFGDLRPLNKEYRHMTTKYLRELEKADGKEKMIYTKGDFDLIRIKGGEYRAMRPELIPPTPTVIYGDTVVQYIYTKPITIIKITSKEIAKTHKEYFNHFWKLAEEG